MTPEYRYITVKETRETTYIVDISLLPEHATVAESIDLINSDSIEEYSETTEPITFVRAYTTDVWNRYKKGI